MEVYVLSELNKRNNRHFCKIEDRGRFGSFNYVVMTLVGKSLQVWHILPVNEGEKHSLKGN